MKPVDVTTYGKWILAGEHAVLRGAPALAFPLTSRALHLHYEPAKDFDVTFAGPHGDELKLLFFGVLESAFERLNVKTPPTGHFRLENSLPVGAGLGASAALCGAVARWCHAQGYLAEDGVYEFARGLEDLFHGESSGIDVAVSLSARGVRFKRGEPFAAIEPKWWPKLYLSYSGQRGMTSECVNKVKRGFETDPERARALDGQMRAAAESAVRALEATPAEGAPSNFEELKRSLDLARRCFEEWNLCDGEVGRHLERLARCGAVSAKPTGSGGGGYVLSLWAEDPPEELRGELVAVGRPNPK